MYKQSYLLLKRKLNPFAAFYTKLTPTLKKINVEERMAIAGGLWRATHSEFGAHCNNKRISKAISLFETNGASVASVPIITPPSPSASHQRLLMSKQNKSQDNQHLKTTQQANKLSMHRYKTKDAKLNETKHLIKNLSGVGVKSAKITKRKNVAKKSEKKTAKLQKRHKSKQSVGKKSFNFAKVQLPTRSLVMAKPQPIIYLPPSNALVPTENSSAVTNPFVKIPTQLRKSIAWHYLDSDKLARNKAKQTHASKVTKSIKTVKSTKPKHTSVKEKQHKSHYNKQKQTQQFELKKNYENFRTAVLRGRPRPIAEVEERGLKLYYSATRAITDFQKRIAMGRSFFNALHRKRLETKFVQQQQQQLKKHKSTQSTSHKSRTNMKLAKSKSGHKGIKSHKSAMPYSHRFASNKQLRFKTNSKIAANMFLSHAKKYINTNLAKKVKQSNSKAKKITSLPLPRSLSINRHHHVSPSFLTSRAKIKAAAKRAKLQRRLSANNARSRLVTINYKPKKNSKVTHVDKKNSSNRHRFIRFFHAMMSTGKIPNKPSSARSSKIKKLWKLVHHRKTHNERVRLGENILTGKLTPAEVATLAINAPRKSIDHSNRMKFKASDFKFAIVPATKNKSTKSVSTKNKV